jgi:hypothetical protein
LEFFGLDVASAFSYFDFATIVAQFYAVLDSLLLVNAGCGITVGADEGYTDITQKSLVFLILLVQHPGLSEGPFGILLRGNPTNTLYCFASPVTCCMSKMHAPPPENVPAWQSVMAASCCIS